MVDHQSVCIVSAQGKSYKSTAPYIPPHHTHAVIDSPCFVAGTRQPQGKVAREHVTCICEILTTATTTSGRNNNNKNNNDVKANASIVGLNFRAAGSVGFASL